MKSCILIILIFFLTCCTEDYKCNRIIDEPYLFPVTPEQVEEWALLQTTEQRLKAVQIPNNILYCLSDKALLETCINYPLYFEYTLKSNSDVTKGFDTLIKNFNGLEELFKRESALKLVIQKFMLQDMYQFASNYGKSRLSYFYMFLSKAITISKINVDQRYEFIKKTTEKIHMIENENPKVLCCNDVELTCCYVIANALYYFQFEPFVTYFKSTNSHTLSSLPPSIIYEYALIFLNKEK